MDIFAATNTASLGDAKVAYSACAVQSLTPWNLLALPRLGITGLSG